MKRLVWLIILIVSGFSYGQTIEQLINTAFEKNPELKSIQSRLKAIKEKAVFESSLPDPIVSISINDIQFEAPFKRDIEPMQTIMFTVSQVFPYKGKLDLKKQTVLKQYDEKYYELLNKKLQIELQIKTLSYEYWLLEETLKVLKQYKKVLNQIIQISQTLYSVGKATQSDVINSHIYLTEILEEEINIKNKQKIIKTRIERIINTKFNNLQIDLKDPKTITNLNLLREKILQDSPQLKILEKTIERYITQLKLAKKDYYPDFKTFFSYAYRDSFNDYVSFGVSFNIPLWKKNRQDKKVMEIQYTKISAEKKYQDRLKELIALLEESYYQCKNAYEVYEILDKTLLNQSLQSLSSVIAEYKVGKRDMLTVLSALKKIINIEKMKLKQVYLWHKHFAKIQYITGKSISRGNRL